MENSTLSTIDSTEVTTPPNTSILKTDTNGRVRYTQSQRDMILEALKESPLTAKRFAEVHGISYSTLYNWKQKRSQTAKAPSDSFVEISITEPLQESVRVTLPNGATAEVSTSQQAQLLAELLKAL